VVDDLTEVVDRAAGFGRGFGQLDRFLDAETETVLACEKHFHEIKCTGRLALLTGIWTQRAFRVIRVIYELYQAFREVDVVPILLPTRPAGALIAGRSLEELDEGWYICWRNELHVKHFQLRDDLKRDRPCIRVIESRRGPAISLV